MTTIYIGPYLVIPTARRTTTAHTRICSKHCDAPSVSPPAKFCGNCGGAVAEEDVPVEVAQPLPIHELPPKWTDYMTRPAYGQNHPNGDVWIPNHGGHGLHLSAGAEDRFKPLALSAIEGDAMLEKAKWYYQAFLAALQNDFGVTATWEVGVVAYSS